MLLFLVLLLSLSGSNILVVVRHSERMDEVGGRAFQEYLAATRAWDTRDEYMRDNDPPLTERGKTLAREAGAGLKSIVPSVRVIYVSKLTRAMQTGSFQLLLFFHVL